MKKIKQLIFLFVILNTVKIGFSQDVFINEIQVSNKKTISDGFGEYDDWIEIYNPNSKAVNLSGMYLTDDLSNPTKHQISSSNSNWVTVDSKN